MIIALRPLSKLTSARLRHTPTMEQSLVCTDGCLCSELGEIAKFRDFICADADNEVHIVWDVNRTGETTSALNSGRS
ncbi:hypothetical protein NMY22_g2129 [Coprinellus aureogranulatus]|nr:hypothetical protein NMY22_g2129 [Coprinellus aureogranulatus]